MEKILIADDEESIRFVLKKTMEKRGYSVELAEFVGCVPRTLQD